MVDPFDAAAGWLQETLLVPLLYRLDMMTWEDVAYGWALFAVYGVAQVFLTFVVCTTLERWKPVEHWPDRRTVSIDIAYTLISRVGVLPLFTYVLFYQAQVMLTGWLTDHGYVSPTLEYLFPSLMAYSVISFLLYVVILDFFDYWRHRLSHRFRCWYAIHSLHHAQRQMTFWSDDRNHLFDELISAFWFGMLALAIGVPPMQFPLLVLVLRFLESLSHANAKVSFGWMGDRLLVSPRFHRAHHGVLAAGQRSCNYGAIFPWWDMIFGTADFARTYFCTGDPSAGEAMHTGNWWQQQKAGLRRLGRTLATRRKVTIGVP